MGVQLRVAAQGGRPGSAAWQLVAHNYMQHHYMQHDQVLTIVPLPSWRRYMVLRGRLAKGQAGPIR